MTHEKVVSEIEYIEPIPLIDKTIKSLDKNWEDSPENVVIIERNGTTTVGPKSWLKAAQAARNVTPLEIDSLDS